MNTINHPSDFSDTVKYELDAQFTRETVTLEAGVKYLRFSAMGKVTASGKHKLSVRAATDGTQIISGILIDTYDATGGDVQGAIITNGPAIIAKQGLVFDASYTSDAQKSAALAGLPTIKFI